MKNNGFTTMELVAATAVLSSLVAAAVGGFYWYIPKAQVTDANALITSTQLELVKNIQKGSCTTDGQPLNIAGKYGTLNISGTFAHRSGGQCLTGCNLTYTFNTNGVSKALAGKKIVLNALHNMKLAHSTSSTVPDKYNPFINQSAYALGENCAASTIQTATITDGVISGSEIGEASPTPTPPVTPTTPTTPTPPVTPTTPTTPPVTPPVTPTTPPSGGTIGTPPPNPNGRANLFPYTVNTGLALHDGIQIAMIPLNLNDNLERGYFDGTLSTSEVVTLHKRMRSRYSSRKGVISVRGSASVNQHALVGASSSFIVAFVIKNARCPTVDELRANGFIVNFSCDLDPSGFDRY